MSGPMPVPLPLRLPPRRPARRLVLRPGGRLVPKFSHCLPQNVESRAKICYTFHLQSRGCPPREQTFCQNKDRR